MPLPFETINRELLVRKESATSHEYGCAPDERPTSDILNYGIVSIDKPSGPTSHQIADYAKRILGITKAGHSGTLDPAVTGLLVVALGRATKASGLLLTAGKEYVGILHTHKDVPEQDLRQVFTRFTGTIVQTPPLKSAVKRVARKRTIYYFEILEIDGRDVLFRVGTQAGTYIRKLCDDIGRKIGGAHMAELRRTKVASFGESTMVTLHDLADVYHDWRESGDEIQLRKYIQPVERCAGHLPKIYIGDSAVDSVSRGASLHLPGIAKLDSGIQRGDVVAVFTLKNELVSYGTAMLGSEEMLAEKGLGVKTEKVFMQPGIYPRFSKGA